MGGRPLVLLSFATITMIVYHYEGSPHAAPRWFLDAAPAVTGVSVEAIHQHLWAHVTALLLLFAIPLALSWSIEGWGPRTLGLGIRGSQREVAIVLGFWLLMVPIVAVAAEAESFQAMYPRVREVRTDASLYLLHEGLYLLKWVAWEFFFRGFLLFGLGKDFLGRAPIVSTVAFALMHIGKPEAEALGAVIAGLVLCHLARRAHSIWPGVILHALVAATMDFFASEWWR
jgi:membrane protease YdiL (CAAX protease family)